MTGYNRSDGRVVSEIVTSSLDRRGGSHQSAPKPASPEQLRARLELRRSSAASKHVPAYRKGTRRVQRNRAIASAW